MTEVERIKARWEKEDASDIDSAAAALLAAPNGRRFVWWLLGLGKIGAQPFTLDPYSTAFSCGELNVGNQIMARLMSANPDLYTEMQKEMLNDARNRDDELAHAADRDTAGLEPDWEPAGGGEDTGGDSG